MIEGGVGAAGARTAPDIQWGNFRGGFGERVDRDGWGAHDGVHIDVDGVRAIEDALDCNKPAVIDVQVDPSALYSFRRDSFKHRGG